MDTPKISMWNLIVKKRMPPTRMVRYCCEYLKERYGIGRMVVTGVRAAESVKRRLRGQIEPCLKYPSKTFMHLIFDWSNNDVWEYIRSNKLPYCSLYDEGFKRLGCICCPMGGPKKQAKEAERWPIYKLNYLRSFERMIQARKDAGIETLQWDTAQDVWDWWTTGKEKEPDCKGQIYMFDD